MPGSDRHGPARVRLEHEDKVYDVFGKIVSLGIRARSAMFSRAATDAEAKWTFDAKHLLERSRCERPSLEILAAKEEG